MITFITSNNYKQYTLGKKAQRLFVLEEKGFNVPPFFCVNQIPDEEELLSFLEDRGEFSVRSAAHCEDLKDYSFAGQFDTFLNVKKEEVYHKVKECFDSVGKESVAAYCNENGINPDNIKMTVIIQKMIKADYSGVIFSANPQGILNESVIVMGKGTGDNVVEEKTDVVTCYYNRNDKKYYTEEMGEDAPRIEGKLVEELISLCQKLENDFGKLIDIEFAIKNEEVFILQVRPITTIDDNEPLILDNSNIVESYPGISLPLTVSFVKSAYSGVFKGLAKRILRDDEIVNRYNETYYNMTGSANGRVYYKISNWYTLLSFLPMSKKIIPIWQDMMGVSEKTVDKDYVRLSFFKRFRTYINVVLEAFSVRRNMERLNEAYPAVEKYFRENFTEEITIDEIKQLYSEVEGKILSIWDITLLNDLYAFVFTGLLKSQIKKSGVKEPEKKVNEFISGISNIESMKPIKAMIKLADYNRDILNDLSGSKDAKELSEKMENYPDFKKKFYQYISLYGDRSPEELKMETVTFREDPLILMKKIHDLSSDRDIFERTKKSLLKTETKSIEDIAYGINKRKRRIKYFAGKASIGIMNREVSRLNRTRIYGMVRSMFLKAGEILSSEGKILEKRDVFYLTMEEVFNGDSREFVHKIEERKNKYKGFYELPAFSRIVFSDKEFDKQITKTASVSKVLSDEEVLIGTPSSPGIIKGEAVVVKDACNPPNTKGKIIVAKMTDPGWVFLLSNSKGIISEKGSLLSHTAIISRELKIPAVVGVKEASEIIKDGDILELDGNSGTIKICKD